MVPTAERFVIITERKEDSCSWTACQRGLISAAARVRTDNERHERFTRLSRDIGEGQGCTTQHRVCSYRVRTIGSRTLS